MLSKCALITGIRGQDGSYLAELLLEKGYSVHGIVREEHLDNVESTCKNIIPVINRITLHGGNLDNYAEIQNIIEKVKPDECYHLSSQSFVNISEEEIIKTLRLNIEGTYFLLQAIIKKYPNCKFYFAGSSE